MFFLQNKSNYRSSLFLIRTISCSSILEINYYSILGLTPAATQNDIKKAYFELSKKHHPDKNQGSVESTSRFRAIKEAYETLGNEKLRKVYDDRIFQRYGQIKTQRHKMRQYENYSYEAEKLFYQNRAKRQYMGKTWYYNFDMWNDCHYPNLKKKRSHQRSWSTVENECPPNMEKSKSYGIHRLLLPTLIFICIFILAMPLFNPPNYNLYEISKKDIEKMRLQKHLHQSDKDK